MEKNEMSDHKKMVYMGFPQRISRFFDKTDYKKLLEKAEEKIGKQNAMIMQLQISKADLVSNIKQLQADKVALIKEKLNSQDDQLIQ